MKVPFILVMVIVSEAMAGSKSLPLIRQADLQIIARMILPYVNLRNRQGKTDFQGNTGGGTGGQAKNRSYRATNRHSDEDDDNVTVDIGLTDFDDEEILIPGSVSRRIITGSETYNDKRRFDDYGHMRFGRSDPTANKKFDDYGHMRFGK